MGLLSRIEGAEYNKTYSAPSIFSYSDFISKYNIDIFGVLKKIDSNYIIENSYGLDFSTICNFYTNDTFWNTIIRNQNQVTVLKKTDNSFQVVEKLFSKKLADSIKSVSFIKNNDFIFLICNFKDVTVDYKSAFSNLIGLNSLAPASINQETEKHLKFSLNFNKAISKQFGLKAEEFEIFRNCILNQIFINLQIFFPTPDFVEKERDLLFVYKKALSPISDDLFLNIIKENFKEFLPDSFNEIEINKIR